MNEFLPILSGLFLGSILCVIPKSFRFSGGLGLISILGIYATIISGEFLISWSFLLIDILLIAVSAFVSFIGIYSISSRLKTNF